MVKKKGWGVIWVERLMCDVRCVLTMSGTVEVCGFVALGGDESRWVEGIGDRSAGQG